MSPTPLIRISVRSMRTTPAARSISSQLTANASPIRTPVPSIREMDAVINAPDDSANPVPVLVAIPP